MAVYSEIDRTPIDELTAVWRNTSLIGEASLLHPTLYPTAWSHASIADLYQRFWGNPIEGADGGGSFESKWELQLEEAPPEVRVLAAECLLIYYLITKSVGPERKIELVNRTLGEKLTELHVRGGDGSPTAAAHRALNSWIANPGLHFNTRQDIHVGYVIDFARRLREMPDQERTRLLREDPWKLADFAAESEYPSDAMRHILCHLLYPEYFERIASNSHKEALLKTFGEFDSSEDGCGPDKQLYSIRQALKERLPGWTEQQRDYYSAELEPIWRPVSKSGSDEALDPAFALEYKKQIVFYGPPGTGKTYRAGKLAEALIRSAALKQWGVVDYFNNVKAVDAAVAANVTRLQMHPSYGYAEFMVGLRLDADGGTSYQLGALPRLLERMQSEKDSERECALPHVLILDEINRTDLSTMFGEAFTAMERNKRGVVFDLFAEGEDGKQMTFSMPEDLYIIGTMNEIDQSVEALDFALRRRFFWFATPYDQDELFTIWEAQWGQRSVIHWHHAIGNLETLARNITSLNKRISQLSDLGSEYELGAAVFSDLPYFIDREWRYKRNKKRDGRYLWAKKSAVQAPLKSLWALSVQPVLAQYLAGSDRRQEVLAELRAILFAPPEER